YVPYRVVLNETAARVAHRLGLRIPPGQEGFLSASIGSWPPFPDTNPALRELRRHCTLGILSNVDDHLLHLTLSELSGPFKTIVTAQQVRSYNPRYPHFYELRRRSKHKRVVHVAQSYFHDIVPAKSLSIPVVWVNRKGERPVAGGPLPDLEVRSLTEIVQLLRS